MVKVTATLEESPGGKETIAEGPSHQLQQQAVLPLSRLVPTLDILDMVEVCEALSDLMFWG